MRHHEAGQLLEAEKLCRQILGVDARHAGSLDLLGVVASQTGRHGDAVALISQAISLKGIDPAYHWHLGMALRGQGKIDEAAAAYERARAIEPGHIEVLYDLGTAHHQKGQLDVAISIYGRVLDLQPDHVEAHHNRGNALQQQGKLNEAVASYRRALALKMDHAQVHNNLGAAFAAQGQLDLALASYERALSIRPDYAEAHRNRGHRLQQQGRLDEAAASYECALALKPDDAEAHFGLGVTRDAQGERVQALASYERTLLLKPDHAEAHYNRGNALKNLGSLREAVDCYRKVLELVPDHANTCINMGVALISLDLDEAEACLRRALELSPDNAAALINLASLMSVRGNPLEGLRLIRQSLRISEAHEAKSIFVACISRIHVANDDSEVRFLVARALEEAWGRPAALAGVAIELIKLNPLTGKLMEAVSKAAPGRLSPQEFTGLNWPSVLGADPLVCALLQSTPASDIAMERFLIATRRALLKMASKTTASVVVGDETLRFQAALASQCFINEYVFSCADDERLLATELRERLGQVLETGTNVAPSWILAVASYFPLSSLRNGARLLEASWPPAVEATLKEQVREPLKELQIRATIPRLTEVDDEVSIRVQSHYEENPYPRWIRVPRVEKAKDIEGDFRTAFPLAPIRHFEKRERTDILISGCGTGLHSIETAQRFSEAEILAIDLSLSSLSYAKRKTQEMGLTSITYARPTC